MDHGIDLRMHDLWFPVPNPVDRDVDRKTTEKHSV